MKYSKRHYEDFADVLGTAWADSKRYDTQTVYRFQEDIIRVFSEDDSRFDIQWFLDKVTAICTLRQTGAHI